MVRNKINLWDETYFGEEDEFGRRKRKKKGKWEKQGGGGYASWEDLTMGGLR